MNKTIVHDPLFLSQKSSEATEADREVISDLLDTLRANLDGCVGMAANMIGVRKNIIAVCIGPIQVAMVNARIVGRKKPFRTEEGCLSLLGGPRPVLRYDEIDVEYLDSDFKPRRDRFSGWTAQIIQHELDHVNGVLI